MDGSITENVSATPNATPLLPYQSEAADASVTYGSHYRYLLPLQLNGLGAGATLPGGFLYIWDESKGTIIEGATFTVPTDTTQARWKFVATGAVLSGVSIGGDR